MSELEEYKNKRRTIKASLTRQQTAIAQFKQGESTFRLETRLEDINKLFQQYNDVQTQIEGILMTAATAEESLDLEQQFDKERTSVENQYYALIADIKSLLIQHGHDNRNNIPENGTANQQTIINLTRSVNGQENNSGLKPLPLPTFSGKHRNWFTFYHSFKALVHDDQNIPTIKKFHYLRGCLRDDALRAVESLSVSVENYDRAIELLQKRFENKRLIVQDHVSNILNMNSMTKSSFLELRQLLDTVLNNIAALEALKLPVKTWDALLIPIICEKLDFNSKKEWQAKLEKDVPKYDDFIKFLEGRYQILESIASVKNPDKNSVNLSKTQKQSNKFITNVITKGVSCAFCKKAHNNYQCNDFLSLGVEDRLKRIQNLKLCHNCLRSNHLTDQCKSKSSCKECNQRHHSLLHIHEFTPSMPSTSSHVITASKQALLSTAVILIADKFGNFHDCRALLDQGSEANLITRRLVKKLKLTTASSNTSIFSVNATENRVSEGINVTIKSHSSDFASNLNCLVLDNITRPSPPVSFDISKIKIPENTKLADPHFNKTGEIDLLIGTQFYWRLLVGGPIHLGENQPHFQATKLGWIVGGELSFPILGTTSCNVITNNPIKNLETTLEQFWHNETLESQSDVHNDSHPCERHFTENTYRAPDGKFVVKLPFKGPVRLGNSREIALKRFLNLEKNLVRNPTLKTSYVNFMNEYHELGHMERISDDELEIPDSYYLPHHAVFKQTSQGRQIRVVFDASAKSTNNLSLNDNLMVGPTLQQGLFSILCRFRTHQFVLSADIKKMYRMVLINPSDRDFQRVLWRNNPNDPIETFRLTTVTYGTSSAPFLAVRALKQLAIESQSTYPITSQIINNDFYMDDLLSGASTIAEAREIRNQITNILASGGFHLCKWASNDPRILPEPSNDNNQSITFDKDTDVKVLGFHWNCNNDVLKYNVDISNFHTNQPITKRTILSCISKIFDPLGLINPVIVTIKILMQKIWALKVQWEDPVPIEIKKIWIKFVTELNEINSIKINRKLIPTQVSHIELHGFADASTRAYGACIYIKTVERNGRVSVNLLCAKSRVAPLKSVTLPRLELNAAVLLAQLVSRTEKDLNLEINRTCLWTDSTIVLSWLHEQSNNWRPYVANRVAIIQKITKHDQWRHVRSGDNAADILSRGTYSRQLINSNLWWYGPDFLKLNESQWPVLNTQSNLQDFSLERKSSTSVNVIKLEPELPIASKFSSLPKLQRIMAYVLRFIKILKNKTPIKGNLTGQELDQALLTIIKHIQTRNFANEISHINDKIKSSKIKKLDPFIDENGLLRVGGRLKLAPINYDNKFPILLPAKHHITKLILRHYHERELHAGHQATLAAVRQRFWPLAGRNMIKQIIHSCVKCFRANPHSVSQKMGDLPSYRIQPLRPFYMSGVDYAGPFLIKDGKTRNKRKVKGYIALFICFSTKAVHLELVSDLTTESFLAAMKRFISRRGHVAEISSDNGTNFVGAERELLRSQQFQKNIADYFANNNTKFNFIPARSPHFGGLWERAVRSVKYHLHRVVGDASLTYEEFYTLMCCIEAILNSRPITPLSPDPNDLEALTPGHFLIGSALTSPIEPDLRELKINRLSRWQRIQQLQQHFWSRWYREYLSELQSKPKKLQSTQENVQKDALVVLVEDNLPPLKWVLGRVEEVHPGRDGLVRVVSVRTKSGIFKRAVAKVRVLPIE